MKLLKNKLLLALGIALLGSAKTFPMITSFNALLQPAKKAVVAVVTLNMGAGLKVLCDTTQDQDSANDLLKAQQLQTRLTGIQNLSDDYVDSERVKKIIDEDSEALKIIMARINERNQRYQRQNAYYEKIYTDYYGN